MQQEKITITHIEEVPLEAPGDSAQTAGDVHPNHPPQKRRRRFSSRFFITVGLMLLALGAGALIYAAGSRDAGTPGESAVSGREADSLSESGENAGSAASPSSAETPPIVSDGSEENSGSESSAETSVEPESGAFSAAEPEVPFDPYAPPAGYNYSSPVPENTAQDTGWFSDAVFIGNSQTQGLLLYAGIPAAACADVGLTVETAATLQKFDDPAAPESETKLTALQYLEKSDYKKVYLLFGINELGWQSVDVFINLYTTLIETIQSTHPDSQIYVQSVLPVGEQASKDQAYLNNTRVAEFNGRLQAMAAELQVYYLDAASAFPNPLPADMSPDGIHLGRDGCETWKSYILSHCVYQTEESAGTSAPAGDQPPVSVTTAPTLPKNDG